MILVCFFPCLNVFVVVVCSRVNQQWQFRIACRKMKSAEMTELQHYLERSSLKEVTIDPYLEEEQQEGALEEGQCTGGGGESVERTEMNNSNA